MIKISLYLVQSLFLQMFFYDKTYISSFQMIFLFSYLLNIELYFSSIDKKTFKFCEAKNESYTKVF